MYMVIVKEATGDNKEKHVARFIFHWLNADLHFWQAAYPILYDNEERT
jgi:hypothetical protein